MSSSLIYNFLAILEQAPRYITYHEMFQSPLEHSYPGFR